MKSRSALFKRLADETRTQFIGGKWPSAKRWLTRVGLPRLTAERVADEADWLLRSIHAGIHRNEPELENMLYDARKATFAYAEALMRDDFRRFEGREK